MEVNLFLVFLLLLQVVRVSIATTSPPGAHSNVTGHGSTSPIFSGSNKLDTPYGSQCLGRWRYPEQCQGYGCDYQLDWEYIDDTDEIVFTIKTKNTNRWTGIGFSDNKLMPETDVVIGIVEETGRFFLMDAWLKDYTARTLDKKQNIHNITAWRENGITSLKFYRYRKTGDIHDFQFSDTHCPYFMFPVRGGVFNAVNKRIRKHEATPIVSEDRICVRSCKTKQLPKTETTPMSMVSPQSSSTASPVPKPEERPQLGAAPKLVANINTKTNRTSTQKPPVTTVRPEAKATKSIISDMKTTQKPVSSSSVVPEAKTSESTMINKTTTQTPGILLPITSKVEATGPIKTDKTTTQNPPSSSPSSSTPSSPSTLASSSTSSTTSLLPSTTFSSTTEKSNEAVKDDYETSDAGNDPDNTKNLTANSDENVISPEETAIVMEIRLPNAWKASLSKKSSSEYRKFMTKIEDQVEKELKDNGHSPKHVEVTEITGVGENSVLASIRVEVLNMTKSPARKDKYTFSLKDALNATVRDGKVGNLNVDPSYLVFRAPENVDLFASEDAKKAGLSSEQLTYLAIIIGLSCLVILCIFQALCMVWRDTRNKGKRLLKEKDLANSHYKDYSATTASSVYENFGVTDFPDGHLMNYKQMTGPRMNGKMENGHGKKGTKSSELRYGSTMERSLDGKGSFGYPSAYNTHDSLKENSSYRHLGQPHALTPDFYFMPHQRRYSGEVVRVFVDYNNPHYMPK